MFRALGRRRAVLLLAVAALITAPGPATATTTTQPLPDGTFIRDVGEGSVYRIAGGAPIYVSAWAAFGGQQPYVDISHAQLLTLPEYPTDGTFIRGTATGYVYRIAGGAPVYVSTWTAFGGPQPTTDVDQVAIQNAGRGGKWNHIRYNPADQTFVRGTATGQVYTFAGGAPIYVSNWAAVGGERPAVNVDQAALDNAGSGGPYDHVRYYPEQGTPLVTLDNRYWTVGEGVARRIEPGDFSSTLVDLLAVLNAGQPGQWSHLIGHVA
ncbi:hypothetical protein [Actinokineospora cianjurensis]|uniref:Tachylectin n=1 Tax=Actinokineospora cianjurensis TaxID=585224 RepID=A0A421B7J3_9PSEU|nr:hypothetical protein [Actinokineospora cianjurensis]RLK60180.1 hypothetical protein CLV68_0679 [Actinokineospora cianjurensis]